MSPPKRVTLISLITFDHDQTTDADHDQRTRSGNEEAFHVTADPSSEYGLFSGHSILVHWRDGENEVFKTVITLTGVVHLAESISSSPKSHLAED